MLTGALANHPVNSIPPIDSDLPPRRLTIVRVYEDGFRVEDSRDVSPAEAGKFPLVGQDERGRFRYMQMLTKSWDESRRVQEAGSGKPH